MLKLKGRSNKDEVVEECLDYSKYFIIYPKFYSSYAWRKLRNRKVKEHPYCERCWSKYKLLTTEHLQGHHIKLFKDYPELRLDEDNIVVLCRACNL